MQPCYDHSNTLESWESIHNDKRKLHNWGDAISPHANWCIFKTNKKNTAMGWRGRDVKKKTTKKTRHRATETDLQSAFDQIEGNDSCVRGATAQNPTKAAQEKILLRAELTTDFLWRNTGETLRTGHLGEFRKNYTFSESRVSGQELNEEYNWFKHVVCPARSLTRETPYFTSLALMQQV